MSLFKIKLKAVRDRNFDCDGCSDFKLVNFRNSGIRLQSYRRYRKAWQKR